MGYNSIKKDFHDIGIKIELTGEGVTELSKILDDGCPVKFDSKVPFPVSCPLQWNGGVNTCKSCWKKFLKNFMVKEI